MAIPVPPPVHLDLMPGTLITCPNCSADIARLKESLRLGAVMDPSLFDMLQPGQGEGDMVCRVCSTPFKHSLTGSLHTSEGWQPPLPRPEPFRG